MSNILTLETQLQRNDENLMSSELGDELVIMDIENGNYIGLNKTGYAIWKELVKPIKLGELIDLLITRYSIDRQKCVLETTQYLKSMADQNLIKINFIES